MKTNYLLSLSTYTVFTLSIILAGRESAVASKVNFYCQINEGKPTTIIKTNNGAEKKIFHWNLAPATTGANPQQMCDSVTQKLNNYLQEGNDLSALTFTASIAFAEKDSQTLPAVCIEGTDKPCQLVLFTLESKPSENPQLAASNALDAILDQELQANQVKSPTRGVQSTAYEVNFWKLLGL